MVGAMRADAMSPRTLMLGEITVLPEYRRRNLANGLCNLAVEVVREHGRGVAGSFRQDNPMPVEDYNPEWLQGFDPTARTWVFIPLGAPLWFRGQGRLRTAAEAVGGRRPRRE